MTPNYLFIMFFIYLYLAQKLLIHLVIWPLIKLKQRNNKDENKNPDLGADTGEYLLL